MGTWWSFFPTLIKRIHFDTMKWSFFMSRCFYISDIRQFPGGSVGHFHETSLQ